MAVRATEIEYLKYFYKTACEIYSEGGTDEKYWISEQFEEETGKKLPDGYGYDEDEE